MKFEYLDLTGLGTLVENIKSLIASIAGKVNHKAAATTKAYITGTTSSTDNTDTQVFDPGVYLDTTAGQLVATTFKGNLDGNAATASTATKLGSNNGTATKPVYFSDGKPVACTYELNATVPSGAKFTDTVYTHPSHTAKTSGLYKITVDALGHVSAATAVVKADITELGIPAQDTTYTAMTASEATTGTATTARSITAKVLHDKITAMIPSVPAVTKVTFTATDSRWGTASNGKYPLTIAASGGEFLNCYRTNGSVYDKMDVSVTVSGNNIIIYSLDKFAGYMTYIK